MALDRRGWDIASNAEGVEFVALASKSIMFCSFCGGEDVDGAVGVASVWTTGAGAGVDPGVASAVAEAGATAGAGGSGFFTTISSPVSGCTMASALVDLCGGTWGAVCELWGAAAVTVCAGLTHSMDPSYTCSPVDVVSLSVAIFPVASSMTRALGLVVLAGVMVAVFIICSKRYLRKKRR